jgi:hypothetical protein
MSLINPIHLSNYGLVRHALSTALIMLLAIVCVGCKSKTEVEQLAEYRDSLVYSKYHFLSEKGFVVGLQAYQKSIEVSGAEKLPELTPQDICIARIVMAYGALISDKRKIALAEADIVSASQCESFNLAAASALRSVIFQRETWPALAAAENEQAKTLLGKGSSAADTETEMLVFHLAMGLSAVQDKNFAQALVHLDAVGLLLGQPWLGKLGAATLSLQQGEMTKGVRDIKRLSEDNSVPPEVRSELVKGIALVEQKTGNVDLPGFMARALMFALWDAAKSEGPKSLSVLIGFVNTQVGSTIDSGVNAAKNFMSDLSATTESAK